MATTALRRELEYTSPTRRRVMGIVFVAAGILIWLLFARPVGADQLTTFGMTPGGTEATVGDLVFPSKFTLNAASFLCLALGGYQLARGFGKRTNLILGIVALMFLFGFLAWAAAGKSVNIAGLLSSSLVKAVPLTLGALSGILAERSGIVNIAIEGQMLAAAMTGCIIGSVTGNGWLGLLGSILTGGLLGWLLGWLSIRYRTDQIVVGTVINIFATGLTSYISSKFLQPYQELNFAPIFPRIPIPLLSDIPFFGTLLFNHNIFVYMMYILLIVLNVALFSTKWGLRLRSVGEHPRAADTLGINVYRTRYMGVILSGMVAGLAGGYFTLGSVGRFDEVMTAGRGFIALAAMIFGNWMPYGTFGAGLIFGFADSLAAKLSILGVNIPSEFMLMAPYIATMVVLAGVVGNVQPPAEEGKPYIKEG